jgi:hypothetical protein
MTLRQISSLQELGHVPDVAIIINCGTKWTTTLALASTLACTDCPVVVIDCESRDGSKRHFEHLAARYSLNFRWLEWPLRPHGTALDALFAVIASDTVLLVDSDVEIAEPRVVDAMVAAVAADPEAYGAGFLHEPAWMGAVHGLPEHVGYYAERMWVPLVLLETAAVRQALERGASFAQERVFGEVPGTQSLSRMLAMRFWLPGLRNVPVLRSAAHDVVGLEQAPAFVEYDTGARIHAALKAQGRTFAAIDPDLWRGVAHFHGVTRAGHERRVRAVARRMRLRRTDNATGERAILAQVQQRLAARYGIEADFAL